MRMLYVLDLGFASPKVNVPVFSLAGQFLGAPDMLDVEAGLAMEYDGGTWTRRAQLRMAIAIPIDIERTTPERNCCGASPAHRRASR